jgi:pimeloyl-ACP methyl ester carboxylesterase
MSTADTLSRVTAPALILKADAPKKTRAANNAAAKALKIGRLVHIDGAGHNLHHDERQQTVRVMREFFHSF